jgi:hypothetical protein
MTGDGVDDIGRFLIKGRYDAVSRECYWTKTYVGAHDVFYRGFREGKGIWGTWEIAAWSHGGFHIWPRQAGEGEGRAEAAVSEEPVDAIATQELAGQIRNPKAEIRRKSEVRHPNQARIPTVQQRIGSSCSRISVFGFPSGFGFRSSDLHSPPSPLSWLCGQRAFHGGALAG